MDSTVLKSAWSHLATHYNNNAPNQLADAHVDHQITRESIKDHMRTNITCRHIMHCQPSCLLCCDLTVYSIQENRRWCLFLKLVAKMGAYIYRVPIYEVF